MKKIGLIAVIALVVLGCSGCSVDFSLKIGDDSKNVQPPKQEAPYVKQEAPYVKNVDKNIPHNEPVVHETTAFYGVWCGGSKTKNEVQSIASNLAKAGFKPQIFDTSEWENLNSERFYVVTAGVCKTEQEAEKLLDRVKNKGYSDAYIKFSGEKK